MHGTELQVLPPPPDELQTPPSHPPPHSDRAVDLEEHSQSSSRSSLYSIPPDEDPRLLSQLEGVLREGTATPSEARRDQDGNRESSRGKDQNGSSADRDSNRKIRNSGDDDEEEEVVEQNDINSEPEMANDSSAEEEDLGEDEESLVETLSLKLAQSSSRSSVKAASIASGLTADLEVARQAGMGKEAGGVEDGKGGQDDPNVRLAILRKLILNELVGNLSLLEAVGGMRAISYLQVRMCV